MRSWTPTPVSQRDGSVLLAVLVMIVLLTLGAYQYNELMLAEYRAADTALKARQVKAVADSGVHYAAALLSNPDTFAGTLGSNPFDNESAFSKIVVLSDTRGNRRTARFSICCPPDPESGTGTQAFRFGVTDESGKLNVNAMLKADSSGQVLHDALMKIPKMTEEIADAIIDWIDADEEQRPNGAESQVYSGGTPAYRCKNGPLDSLEELLLVRGVTAELLFGTDRNRNGMEDPGEDNGNGWDPGWSRYLTVYSRERNVDSSNAARTFLNETDLKTSYDKLSQAIGQSMADFIVLYRTQTPVSTSGGTGGSPAPTPTRTRNATDQEIREKVNSVLSGSQSQPRSIASRYELVGAAVTFTVGQGRNQTTVRVNSPMTDTSQIRTLLATLLDKTTTQQVDELPGRINVNTASREVIRCLPQMEDSDVEAVMERRPSMNAGESVDEVYKTPAWLMTEANLSSTKMRALERYVTARTQVYRIQVLAEFDQGGPFARVEAIIDTNNGKPRIVMMRDLTELGRGFDLNR